MRSPRLFLSGCAALALSCGGGYGNGNGGGGTPMATCPAGTRVVVVGGGASGMSFSPQLLTVSAGDTVCWVWSGALAHNVISGTACAPDGLFCSPAAASCGAAPLALQGALYTRTFPVAGTFDYYCSSHCAMGMTGRIVVQ